MFHRVALVVSFVLSLAMAALATACGGAQATPEAPRGEEAVAEAEAPTAGDELTLTTEAATSPAELREEVTRNPPLRPYSDLEGSNPQPAMTAAPSAEVAPPSRAEASGEPHQAPPSVSSDPVGRDLTTTVVDVDTEGDAHLRHGR